MSYRNLILMGALVLGIAIMVIMYVRRGFVDLQGQIDDIETVLASMPPALTSGAWSGTAGEGIGASLSTPPTLQPSESPTKYYNLDEDIEGNKMDGYGEGSDNDDDEEEEEEEERVETLIENEMPLFDLSGAEVTGIATLSEPGYYEAGGMQLEVIPIGAGEGDDYDINFELSELEPLAGVQEGGKGEDVDEVVAVDPKPEAKVVEKAVNADEPVDKDIEELHDEDSSLEIDESSELDESSEPDEFSQLTLPELKARLKVLQPETKGLARLKRAEVLDRIRSTITNEVDSD